MIACAVVAVLGLGFEPVYDETFEIHMRVGDVFSYQPSTNYPEAVITVSGDESNPLEWDIGSGTLSGSFDDVGTYSTLLTATVDHGSVTQHAYQRITFVVYDRIAFAGADAPGDITVTYGYAPGDLGDGNRVYRVALASGLDTLTVSYSFDVVEGKEGVFSWDASTGAIVADKVLDASDEGDYVLTVTASYSSEGVTDSSTVTVNVTVKEGVVCRPDEITPETISYLATVMDDVRESTARLYLRNLGHFLGFLTGYDPVPDADILWNDSDLIVNRRFLSDAEWSRLIDHADPTEYLMLMLGGTLGMRRAEIADLRFDDIDGGMITIRGKGHGPNGKMVRMVMPDSVRAALAAYIPVREGVVSLWGDHTDGRVLVRGHVHPGEAMTPDTVGDAVHALGRRAGVECSTHCLRRYYCTRLYRAGVDPDTLCQMMRHERFDTTRKCYIQPDSDRVLAAQRALLASIRT